MNVKRFLVGLGTLAMLVFTASPALAAAPPQIKLPGSYTDAGLWATGGPQGWAATSISDASLWGVIQGYPNGTFQPQGNITRCEFAAMLSRAMGNAAPDPAEIVKLAGPTVADAAYNVGLFKDTPMGPQAWYSPYLTALEGAGILGTGMYPTANFACGGSITRAEAAAWIAKALSYLDVPPPTMTMTASPFSDVSLSGNWTYAFSGTVSATTYDVTIPNAEIAGASAYGVIKGYPDGTFHPNGLITRAEAAAMLTRFVAALPGYDQLAMQTPWIANGDMFYGAPCARIPYPGPYTPALPKGTTICQTLDNSVVLTNADLGFTPATTTAAFQAEPMATWEQIHLWIATANWMALGEAKLNQQEATYVYNYGLQSWQVGMVGLVASQYTDSLKDSPLWATLEPDAASLPPGTGTFTPVTSLALVYPGGGGWQVTGAAGTQVLAAGTIQDKNGYWQIDGIMGNH